MRHSILSLLLALAISLVTAQTPAETATATSSPGQDFSTPEATETPTVPTSTAGQTTPSDPGGSGTTTTTPTPTTTSIPPADVSLKVPELSVGRIELDVDNLSAEINLAAEVARLVTINAGVQIGVEKVNITIVDVEAELELVVRLGHLVDIVNRTLQSLDLNPLLINLLDTVGDVLDDVIGAVDGLLGSIVSGDARINFIIDNLGNIVQETVRSGSDALSTIIGNYRQNMTFTGSQKMIGDGLVERTYEYTPLNSLVNIVFNTLGQVVRAVVVKGGGTGSPTSSSTTVLPTSSAAPITTAPATGA